MATKHLATKHLATKPISNEASSLLFSIPTNSVFVVLMHKYCISAKVSDCARAARRCLQSQVFFRKRVTNYRALFRKMSYEVMAFYGSWPPCRHLSHVSIACLYRMSLSLASNVSIGCLHVMATMNVSIACLYLMSTMNIR